MTKERSETEKVLFKRDFLTNVVLWMGMFGFLGLVYFNYFPLSSNFWQLRLFLLVPMIYVFKFFINTFREQIIVDQSTKIIRLRRTFGEWKLSKSNVAEWWMVNFYTRWGRGYLLKCVLTDGKKVYYPLSGKGGVVEKIELFNSVLGSEKYKGMIKTFDYFESLLPDFLR